MEEKDVNSIASAVTNALAKLDADTAAAKDNEEKNNTETFRCPDCDAPVKGGIAYCQACGCELEWGE